MTPSPHPGDQGTPLLPSGCREGQVKARGLALMMIQSAATAWPRDTTTYPGQWHGDVEHGQGACLLAPDVQPQVPPFRGEWSHGHVCVSETPLTLQSQDARR